MIFIICQSLFSMGDWKCQNKKIKKYLTITVYNIDQPMGEKLTPYLHKEAELQEINKYRKMWQEIIYK